MTAERAMKATIVLVAGAAVLVSTLVLGLLVASQTVGNTVTIKGIGVGVFSDSQCTSPLSSIDWGMLGPGESKSVVIYIRNNGTVSVDLNMTTNGWNPSTARGNMTFGWNCTGYLLPRASVVGAQLTLTISANVTGIDSFGFNIVITGTEHP